MRNLHTRHQLFRAENGLRYNQIMNRIHGKARDHAEKCKQAQERYRENGRCRLNIQFGGGSVSLVLFDEDED